MFVGITFPFFGGLLGFFGGFAFAPTTYFVSALFFLNKNNFLCFKKTNLFFLLQLPCIMWLAIYKPKKFSLSWITNWVCKILPTFYCFFKFFPRTKFQTLAISQICIIFGVLLMIIAPIGGLRLIVLQAKTYKFYS